MSASLCVCVCVCVQLKIALYLLLAFPATWAENPALSGPPFSFSSLFFQRLLLASCCCGSLLTNFAFSLFLPAAMNEGTHTVARKPANSLSQPLVLSPFRSLSLSLSEFCECTFWPSGNAGLLVCVSASARRTRLQRSAQLWQQAGFSFIVRRLERFASVPAPLIWIWIRILGFSVSRLHASSDSRFLGYLATPIVGYSRQTRLLCEILHSPHWPDGRFFCPTDLGSDRRRRSLLQRLPASLPALLRISNVGLSVSVVVVVACLLLTLVAVCEFLFIFYSHTHTQTDTHTHAHAHAHYL